MSRDDTNTREFMLKNPKKGAWYSVMALCAVIYMTKDLSKIRRTVRELQEKIQAGPPSGI